MLKKYWAIILGSFVRKIGYATVIFFHCISVYHSICQSTNVLYIERFNIKQNDFYSYSDIKSIEFGKSSYINLYPNPAVNKITIKASDKYKNATIKIMNIAGMLIQTNSLLSYDDGTIDVSGLASGIYFMIVEKGDSVKNIKFSIQK